MFHNEIRPYESNTGHFEKPCNSLGASKYVFSMLKPEIYNPEYGLDFSSSFVSGYLLFGGETDKNLKFRHTVRVLNAVPCKINRIHLCEGRVCNKNSYGHL